MVKTYEQYIGAVTVNKNPGKMSHEPDRKVPIPAVINTGRSSAAPLHWGASNQLSRGRYGAGANPKNKKKKMKRHVDSYKKYSKRIEEDQMVMGQNPQAVVPQQFQGESDSLSQEEANLLKQLASVKERRIALDKKIADSNKASAQQAADLAAQQANQAQQNAQQA